MTITFEQGKPEDIGGLEQLYNELTDHLAATTNYPGWKKGIYPQRQTAVDGVKEGSLYLARQGDAIIASVILRHASQPAYRGVRWQISAEDPEVLVVYTFTVHPAYQGRGVGRAMMDFVLHQGQASGAKAIRLDVSAENAPAIRLYESCGFQYIDTVDLGLGEYGLPWFRLYEKVLRGGSRR